MREIITLQVGQAGTQVGQAWWNSVLQEHGLSPSGLYVGDEAAREYKTQRLDVLFHSLSSGKYVPRALFVDLEPGTLDVLSNGDLKELVRPDSLIKGLSGAGNNFSKGFYTEGAELVEEIMDRLRKEMEDCDCPQGVSLLHSLGGGTGSGLGSLLLGKIKEEFPDRITSTYSVLPSPKVSDTVVEPYNTTLALHQLVEHSDLTFNLDNKALYDICTKRLGIEAPQYKDLNHLIAQTMSGISTTLRFPGQLNSDFRKLAVNLVPFPRLHFMCVGMAPLTKPGGAMYEKVGIPELTSEIFNPSSFLAACNPSLGTYLTTAVYYRGKGLSSRAAEEALFAIRTKNPSYFADWIPNSSTMSLCAVPPLASTHSATFVANNTAVQELFTRTHAQFSAMLRRKAFLHWYTGEGMDEMEFTEAESNILDLIQEYQQYESTETEEEDDETVLVKHGEEE